MAPKNLDWKNIRRNTIKKLNFYYQCPAKNLFSYALSKLCFSTRYPDILLRDILSNILKNEQVDERICQKTFCRKDY